MYRGQGLGNILGGLFWILRTLFWSGTKSVGKEAVNALGREALRTGTDIIRDVAANSAEQTADIISRHVNGTTQNMIDKLRGSGNSRKRKRAKTVKKVKRKRRKTGSRIIRRDIFS
jgi:translation elongation factor EF-4